jgi:hypothetical protein
MEGLPTNSYNSTSYNRFNFARTAQNFRAQARSDNLLLVILFGIFVFVLVYLLILYNRPSLLNYTLTPTPIKLDKDEIKPLPNSDKLPSLTNGREYAYSFWLYLESVKKNDNYNLVLLRTPNSDSNFLQNANPIIYFDKNSNKLVIKVRTALADQITFDNLDSIIEGEGTENEVSMHNDNCKYATFKIDYVPLQRWVNIIVNVNNNMLAVIMDGAIHSTRILNENNLKCTEDASSNLVSPTAGTLMIGNINEDTNILPGADGYISRIQFFNYSLKTPAHIKKIYNSGPVKSVGILQKIGLPLYGIRNPLYRIDEVKKDE